MCWPFQRLEGGGPAPLSTTGFQAVLVGRSGVAMLAALRVAHDLQMVMWLPREANCGFTPRSRRGPESRIRDFCANFREKIYGNHARE